MGLLTDRVVMVTGANGNLGRAVTQRVREAGGQPVLVARSAAALEAVRADGDDLLPINDLTDPGEVDAAVAELVRRHGRLDALVHTVGTFRGGAPVHEGSLDDWDLLLAVNLRTALVCCRAVAAPMLARGRGSIVTVGSRNSLRGSGGYAAYSVAKTAVLRLTESLSDELKAGGVTANCILPGTIDTPENRAAMPDADTATWVTPEAVADAVVFLVSPAGQAVTGAALPVFGRG